MYFVLLRGPGGAGKTTLAKGLAEKLRESHPTGLISADSFYWDIAGHDPNPQIMYDGLTLLTDLYLGQGYNFIVEGMLTRENSSGRLLINDVVDVARDHGADLRQFHVSADVNVLYDRQKEKYDTWGKSLTMTDVHNWVQNSARAWRSEEIQIDTSAQHEMQTLHELLKNYF